MTAELRRAGSAVAFHAATPPPPDLAERLAGQRFRTIENAASEEVSVGWCTPADPSGDTFDDVPDLLGATRLRIRMDEKKLPAEWLNVHRAAAERAKGSRLTARERRELKADLCEKLLPRVLPKVTFVDVLWVPQHRTVLLLASGKKATETLRGLWAATIGGDPLPLTSEAAASCLHGLDVHRMHAVRWPGGGAGDDEGFLGQEFLLWLWWRADSGESQIDGGPAWIIDDLLVFAPRSDDEHEQTIRRGEPSRAPEARTALREGHRISKAKLLIADGTEQWTVTIDGASLALSGVKLPEDAEDSESAEDRDADRARNWWRLYEIVSDLYGRFLAVRGSDKWKDTVEEMACWMGAGTTATNGGGK